jgi:AraC family transcriptional regulator
MSAQLHPSPLISKRSAAWNNIRLEHHLLDRGHFPEHFYNEHAAIVSIGPSCMGELKTESGFCSRGKGVGDRGVLVLPALRSHTVSIDGPSEYISLFIEPELVVRAATEAGIANGAEIVETYVEHDPLVTSVAMALLAEVNQEGLCGRLYAESLANILTVHLLRKYTATGSNVLRFSGGLSAARLRRVLDYMMDNYELDLSLADLADEAGISPFHFAREFKKTTGHAPHQYLLKLRIERAKALLSATNLPIVEVGLQTGFSSQSHFTRLFRKATGVTPKGYRATFQRHM